MDGKAWRKALNSVHRGFILRELIKRDFQSRYIGSALGSFWSILHPFWQLVLYTFVFGLVMRIAPPPELTDSFAIFLFAGIVPWLAVQEGINRSANALTDNATLIKKLNFPPELLVVSSVIGGLIQSMLAGTVLLFALLFRQELSVSTLPWLIFVIPFQIALTAGFGLVFAAVNVFLRDVSQFLTIALNAWFFLTPIVYTLALVKNAAADAVAEESDLAGLYERCLQVIDLNPLTAIVEMYRYSLMGGPGYSGAGLWVLSVGSVVLLAAGWLLFKHLEPGFADDL